MASLAWVIDITQELWQQHPPDGGSDKDITQARVQRWSTKFEWSS